ncbi:MAG TPA: Maf family protein [Steroidobacteraceae bacterium]|nr:Maf family protein [Steroidobacteraceae bacterium]
MPLWLAAAPLVLASRSAVRRTLLEAAGVAVEVCPADVDERGLEAGAPLQAPVAIAAMLAREKALVVDRTKPGRLILGADQTLSLDGARFAKPADRSAARAQLRALSGRTHELYSAIVFVQDAAVLFEYVGVARLTMRTLSDSFLEAYLDAVGDAATASVGAYQIEGLGVQLFERIDGDYFTVLGLPLTKALEFLRRQGCLQQ